MRSKILACVVVLFSAVALFAQWAPESPAPAKTDAQTQAPAPEAVPAPAPAPAPEVAPAPAPVVAPEPVAAAAPAVEKPKGPEITWSGLAMIRLREDIIQNTAADKIETSSNNYSNRLAYKIGAKIQANPQVSFMFELGNEWYATELVSGGNMMGAKRGLYDPMFLQAWAQWDPGCLHMQVGIDPVKGSATMDLIGMSLLFNRNYVGGGFQACQLPWGVTNNFMYPGLRVGAPILKDDFKLGIDVFSGIAEERTVTTTTAALFKDNSSAIINIVDIPMSVGALTLAPQFVIILNRNFRDDAFVTDESDNEMAFGSDFGYKVNKEVSLRAGFGMAMVSNANTKRASVADTLVGVPEYDRQGMNVTLGSSIKMGPGKLDLDFNFGTNEDKKIADNQATYEFVDVKYGWAVAKNFIIMPRTRVYLGQVPAAGYTDKASNMRVWPEIMLFGSF
jgi:hypothetical protein